MASSPVLPSIQKVLFALGENIKLARLRRKLSAEQVAERANISRKTLWVSGIGFSCRGHGNLCADTFCIRP